MQSFRERKWLLKLLGSCRNRRRNASRRKRNGWLQFPSHLHKTSVAHQRSMKRQVKDPKRRKRKSSRSLLFIQIQEKEIFSKEELVGSDLEETASIGSLSKRKNYFPKEEPVSEPEEAENRCVPKKKRKF